MAEPRQSETIESRNRKPWQTVKSVIRKLKPKQHASPKQNKAPELDIEGRRRKSILSSDSSTGYDYSAKDKPVIICSSAGASITEIPDHDVGPRRIVHKALVVARKGEYEIRHDFPTPNVGSGEIMIRSQYVVLNPIDWKSVDYNFCIPAFPWEYVVVPFHTTVHIPATVSFEQAACFGVAALTAAMTLWKWLGVPMPSGEPLKSEAGAKDPWLLIWGGSAVTGQFATQLAVLGGFNVVTVSSAETRTLSETLGASHVVVRDGKSDEELVEEVRLVTKGGITHAIDLVGARTAALALQAVSRDKPVAFAPLSLMSVSQTVPDNVTVQTVEMKQFVLNKSNLLYMEELRRLLEGGALILPEVHVIDGGLEVIPEGLEIVKRGNMKGKKIVVRV